VRAAIVSDLHLGMSRRADLLRRPPALDALAIAIGGVDELVLLGDTIELRERPVAAALADALPVLRRLGQAAARAKRITIVPGNHDHQLLPSRGGALAAETVFEPQGDGPLAAVAGALGPGRVRVAYPGLWVRGDVYATHGHYLDVHNTVPSFERLAIGAVRRVRRADPPATPNAYEAAVAPVYDLAYAMAQRSRRRRSVAGSQSSVRIWNHLNGHGGRATALALSGAVAGLNRAGLGPLEAELSPVALRTAALRAMTIVTDTLGIDAAHVVFGHTHRSGPHPRDDGWGRLMNTGSWIHEPAFLGGDPKASPYWPGHVVLVPEEGPPELVRVLEELPA
jgi:predicted phosphodiesterase